MKFNPAYLVAAFAALVTLAKARAWSLGRGYCSPMRPMIVYSPGRASSMFKEANALANRAFTQTSPRFEITDTDEKFQVALDVPGVEVENINVSLDEAGTVLSVAGSREMKKDSYEFTSKFSQSFSLDPAVDIDKFTASLKNGVLVVSAPKDLKRIETTVRKIPIMQDSATEEINVSADAVDESKEEPSVEEKVEETDQDTIEL